MKMIGVAIHDSKAEVFTPPIFVNAVGAAIRSFADGVNGGQKDWAAHPADYTLFAICQYDDQTGIIEPLKSIQNLGNGSIFKETKV